MLVSIFVLFFELWVMVNVIGKLSGLWYITELVFLQRQFTYHCIVTALNFDTLSPHSFLKLYR